MFGYDEDIKGTMVLMVDPNYVQPNPEGAVIGAVTRTYNVGSDLGTYGQTVPSLVVERQRGVGTVVITGARNDADFRSNLGIATTSPMSPRCGSTIAIKDPEGTAGRRRKNIRIASMNQWSFQQLGVGEVDGPLAVELVAGSVVHVRGSLRPGHSRSPFSPTSPRWTTEPGTPSF